MGATQSTVDQTVGEAPGRGKLVEIARSLEPLIREHESAIENERTMPRPLVDALYDAGVFKAFWPREVDGLEVDPVEWLAMVEELSKINGSVGWLALIHATGMTFLKPEVFERLRAKTGGRYINAVNFGRLAGRAKRVEGGYRISGHWPFVSGSPHATWLGGASVLYDENDVPVMHPDGLPWIITGVWQADQAKLIDTWDGLGLRGTGSGDMVVEDIFVPDEQINHLGFHDLTYDRPLYRAKELPIMGHAAHALGLARGVQESFLAQMREKAIAGSMRQMVMGHQQAHQIAYAKSDTLVRAARSFLYHAVSEAYENVQSKQHLDLGLKVQMREALLFAVRSSKEAINLIFEMGGSSAVYRGRPIERAYRDISTAANHILVGETEYASVGSYYLTKDLEDGPEIEGRPFF